MGDDVELTESIKGSKMNGGVNSFLRLPATGFQADTDSITFWITFLITDWSTHINNKIHLIESSDVTRRKINS